jgi:hypothetical protein
MEVIMKMISMTRNFSSYKAKENENKSGTRRKMKGLVNNKKMFHFYLNNLKPFQFLLTTIIIIYS